MLQRQVYRHHIVREQIIMFSNQTNMIDVSKICGNIRIVKRFPDFKVQIVTGPADLEVELVEKCCYSPGKWKIVSGYGDYQIKLVNQKPDFTVRCINGIIRPPRH